MIKIGVVEMSKYDDDYLYIKENNVNMVNVVEKVQAEEKIITKEDINFDSLSNKPVKEELPNESSDSTVDIDSFDLNDSWNDPWKIDSSKIQISPMPPSSVSSPPPYEPQLNPNIQGMNQTLFDILDPIDADESVLDGEIIELEKMSISSIREKLVAEIKELEDAEPRKRNIQLQKIFNQLIGFQPNAQMFTDNIDDFLSHEQRFYIDLISTPELYQTPFVRKFLEEKFYVSSLNVTRKRMLLKIYDYYDKHSEEAIEKINYILRSSDLVGTIILNQDINLESFFNEDVMKSFSKEDLSQLFRFYFVDVLDRNNLETLFSPENHKSLFIISQLAKKVNSLTGHSSEFLESALEMFNNKEQVTNFRILLEDIYDKFVGNIDGEIDFSKFYLDGDNFTVMKELINYIVLNKYDSSLACKDLQGVSNLESFLSGFNEYRNLNHEYVLGIEGLSKFKSNTFDHNHDFRAIENDLELEELKKGMLYNIYGISLDEAEHIHNSYCSYMSDLERGIIEEDRPIFEMLKAINSIYSLKYDDPNFKDKLHVLQNAYYNHISEKGLTKQESIASAIIIEGLLNRMYMNTYNKRLTQFGEDFPIIKYDDGVKVIDAGFDFEMIITSLYGVSNFYDSGLNMASKWNTAAVSRNQGICASYLSSRNLGVISLKSPILGFSHVPKDSLNMMGSSDIWTRTNRYNLRQANDSRKGNNRFFIPGNKMEHETRFGYNEILIDRFLLDDKEGKLKLQPDYILYYKLNDNYENDFLYLNSKKTARDFGIPIVLVDVPKLKEYEKNTILKMEEELFSSEFSEEKLSAIVTRYMDNYTGSLTLAGEKRYKDFSITEMGRFFDDVIKHIEKLDEPALKARWINALNCVYYQEQVKNEVARSVGDYKSSVKGFILDDKYDLGKRIFHLQRELDLEKTEDLEIVSELSEQVVQAYPKVKYDGKDYRFTSAQSMSVEAKAIIDLAEYLEIGSKFETIKYMHNGVEGLLISNEKSSDLETVLVENLMASYLIGDNSTVLMDVLDNYGCEINVDFDSNIGSAIGFSPYVKYLKKDDESYIGLSKSKVDLFVDKIEKMSEDTFLSIFSPVIKKHSQMLNESYENIASKLLERKNKVRDNFEYLGKKYGYKVDDSKTGSDEIGQNFKSK